MKQLTILLLVVLLFTSLGLFFSYPLVSHFNSQLPYAYAPATVYAQEHLVPGDYLLLYYIYWLFTDYFHTPGQTLWRDPYMFSVSGWPQPYEPRGLPSSVLFLLFSPSGNVFAYNCVIILSFILCGLFTFLLARKYLRSIPGALAAAIIFALSPFRLTQLFGGHPTGFLLFWIPLIIYLYELLWEKKNWTFGWLAGLCIFLMTMEEHHMGYYTALFSAVFWLYKIFFNNKEKFSFSSSVKLLVPVALGYIASIWYMLYIKSTVIGASIAGAGRTFAEIKLYAPTARLFFQRINPDGEKCIYIGIMVAILLLAALGKRIFLFAKNKDQRDNFPCLFYLLTFVTTLLLSLGPNLTYFPIYRLCYRLIPFFHYPRAPARIFMYTLLASSLLAGYGLKTIVNSFNKKIIAFILAAGIIFLLCLDFHPFPRIGLSTLPSGNRTYDHIKKISPDRPLLEIPLWPGDSSWSAIYQFYTTIYRIPLINGYSPFVTRQYVDNIFWPLVSINMGMINSEQYALLQELNVEYINLHEEAYPQKVNPFPFKTALQNLAKSPYLEFILKDGPVYLFRVRDIPLPQPPLRYTLPASTGIFYQCENMPHRIGRVVEDPLASGNKALFAEGEVAQPAHMIFGPWQLFPPGKYKLLFRLKTGKPAAGSKKIATLEVTTDNGNKQIASRDLLTDRSTRRSAGIYQDYLVHFSLEKLNPLEFRIIYYGTGPLTADYVYLLSEAANDPEWHYEAEELFHTGREKDRAVYLIPEKDPGGTAVFGPYRRYPAGRYRVTFRIRADRKTPRPAAKIEVTSGHSESALAEKILRNISGEYQDYYLDLELDKPDILEFRVRFLQQVPVYIDHIEVTPRSRTPLSGKRKS